MQINRNIGGTLIIAGTAIGAGMLVLPLIATPLGFLPSTLLLCFMWAVMTYASFIALEVLLHFPQNRSIASIGRKVLGNTAEIIALLSILILFYALLSAYISALSEIIVTHAQTVLGTDASHFMTSCATTVIFAAIIFSSIYIIDLSNRVLIALKVIFFAALMAIVLPHFSSPIFIEVQSTTSLSWTSLALALPVLFTSFGFHGSIPSMIEYMQRDRAKIKRAFLIGSLIPLVAFFIWMLLVMSVIPKDALMHYSNLGSLITALSHISNSTSLPYIIAGFSFMAIATSFLGVALSLFDFIVERFHYNREKRSDRFQAIFITFIIPLAINIMRPQLFIAALGFAAIALCVIAIIIPVLCAFKMDEVKLSKPGLWITLACGILIIVAELYNIFYLV
jgi:tyrosine-specific transport protein